MSNEQIPSIGRIVHYVAYGTPGGEFPVGAHRAAIITEVDPPETVYAGEVDSEAINRELAARPRKIGLVVFNPTGQYFNRHCPYDETGTLAGSWHFPERV